MLLLSVYRYLNEVLHNVSFGDDNPVQQAKLEKVLSFGLTSELQCLRSGCCYISFLEYGTGNPETV